MTTRQGGIVLPAPTNGPWSASPRTLDSPDTPLRAHRTCPGHLLALPRSQRAVIARPDRRLTQANSLCSRHFSPAYFASAMLRSASSGLEVSRAHGQCCHRSSGPFPAANLNTLMSKPIPCSHLVEEPATCPFRFADATSSPLPRRPATQRFDQCLVRPSTGEEHHQGEPH